MSRLEVNNIDVSYSKTPVVTQVNFHLAEGQIGCLLGPSGCGKTTVLLAIAGFQQPTSGDIVIGGQKVSDATMSVAPENRSVGMVFQDYALFPNRTVEDNIRFGIEHLDKPEQNARVSELLALVGLVDLAKAYPHQLSGGQQQRVALARAMAPRPNILLLDEPFSNLDVELREQLAKEVRQILKQENVTAILVTHDQQEAFAMADDICVMNKGKVEQQGSPTDLYRQPVNAFVAGFIGEGVLVSGFTVNQSQLQTELGKVPFEGTQSDNLNVLVRPYDVIFDEDADLKSTIVNRVFRGSNFLYELVMPSGTKLLSLLSSDHLYEVDTQVGVRWKPQRVIVFKKSA